jgi:dihydroorotate dehydrogenase (NAD+) catalytic subunit
MFAPTQTKIQGERNLMTANQRKHASESNGSDSNNSPKIVIGKPLWDPSHSFEWNSEHGPFIDSLPKELPPSIPTPFLSWQLRSPIGVAAGPAINSHFVFAYAKLGYSIITYKTVRTRSRHAHPAPVLGRLQTNGKADIHSSEPWVADNRAVKLSPSELSSANSVGIPSVAPEIWMEDIKRSREVIGEGQILVVSVAGTAEENGTSEQLAEDFAQCARWAVESGADMIEMNLSCPNIRQAQGDVYLDPTAAALIVKATRAAIGKIPLSAKLGHFSDMKLMHMVLKEIVPSLDALSLINAVRLPISTRNGKDYFPGRAFAGVGGAAILHLAQDMVRQAVSFIRENNYKTQVIGVGGITMPEHVDRYLTLGANVAEAATSALWLPNFVIEYAQQRQKIYSTMNTEERSDPTNAQNDFIL